VATLGLVVQAAAVVAACTSLVVIRGRDVGVLRAGVLGDRLGGRRIDRDDPSALPGRIDRARRRGGRSRCAGIELQQNQTCTV
jgi:hypothetical protein